MCIGWVTFNTLMEANYRQPTFDYRRRNGNSDCGCRVFIIITTFNLTKILATYYRTVLS